MPAGADVSRGGERAILPADTDELARVLVQHPQATIVAGATDVGLWVTKQLRPISPGVFIGHLMKGIEVGADEIRIGAGVTYSEFAPVIDEHFPEVEDYFLRIGGWQIRNAGTIGGNIANGSPIGETPPLLIALGARIVLRLGDARRELPLEKFFLEYGRQDRRPGEFVETVIIPRKGGALIAAYKMSKRQSADISAISAGGMSQLWIDFVSELIPDAMVVTSVTPTSSPMVERVVRRGSDTAFLRATIDGALAPNAAPIHRTSCGTMRCAPINTPVDTDAAPRKATAKPVRLPNSPR